MNSQLLFPFPGLCLIWPLNRVLNHKINGSPIASLTLNVTLPVFAHMARRTTTTKPCYIATRTDQLCFSRAASDGCLAEGGSKKRSQLQWEWAVTLNLIVA